MLSMLLRRSAGAGLRLSRVGAAMIGCAALVAGCSTGGEPIAAPSSSQSIVGPAGTATVPASANPYPVDKLWRMQNTLPKSRLTNEFKVSTLQPPCSTIANAYGCSWSSLDPGSNGYGYIADASTWSFEELKSRPNFGDFLPVRVGGQEAVRWSTNDESLTKQCSIGWGTSFGVVWAAFYSDKERADTCDRAAEFAEMLHEYAPR